MYKYKRPLAEHAPALSNGVFFYNVKKELDKQALFSLH